MTNRHLSSHPKSQLHKVYMNAATNKGMSDVYCEARRDTQDLSLPGQQPQHSLCILSFLFSISASHTGIIFAGRVDSRNFHSLEFTPFIANEVS